MVFSKIGAEQNGKPSSATESAMKLTGCEPTQVFVDPRLAQAMARVVDQLKKPAMLSPRQLDAALGVLMVASAAHDIEFVFLNTQYIRSRKASARSVGEKMSSWAISKKSEAPSVTIADLLGKAINLCPRRKEVLKTRLRQANASQMLGQHLGMVVSALLHALTEGGDIPTNVPSSRSLSGRQSSTPRLFVTAGGLTNLESSLTSSQQQFSTATSQLEKAKAASAAVSSQLEKALLQLEKEQAASAAEREEADADVAVVFAELKYVMADSAEYRSSLEKANQTVEYLEVKKQERQELLEVFQVEVKQLRVALDATHRMVRDQLPPASSQTPSDFSSAASGWTTSEEGSENSNSETGLGCDASDPGKEVEGDTASSGEHTEMEVHGG